jgi:hypothetical protein
VVAGTDVEAWGGGWTSTVDSVGGGAVVVELDEVLAG